MVPAGQTVSMWPMTRISPPPPNSAIRWGPSIDTAPPSPCSSAARNRPMCLIRSASPVGLSSSTRCLSSSTGRITPKPYNGRVAW